MSETTNRIFSGDSSVRLWADINRVGDTGTALYSLGCKCQELESLVRKLEARVAELENSDERAD